MNFRTDLALEYKESLEKEPDGVACSTVSREDIRIIHMRIEDERGAKELQRPVGNYVTIEVPPFSDYIMDNESQIAAIAEEFQRLLPKAGLTLVVGLGNREITPDALGPLAVQRILVTRHIGKEVSRTAGLDALRPVAAIAPGVLGQTGMETLELIHSLAGELRPSSVIVIDALAARKVERLGCTIQLSDTGISPGAGIGNHRPCINEEVIGAPVISVGVPTVVDAATLAADLVSPENQEDARILREMVAPRGEAMMVTPKEIDLLVHRAAHVISMAINCSLQPDLSVEEIGLLMS